MFESLHDFKKVSKGLGDLRDPAVLKYLNSLNSQTDHVGKVQASGCYICCALKLRIFCTFLIATDMAPLYFPQDFSQH